MKNILRTLDEMYDNLFILGQGTPTKIFLGPYPLIELQNEMRKISGYEIKNFQTHMGMKIITEDSFGKRFPNIYIGMC